MSVDENTSGVWVRIAVGAAKVGCAFCAATVCATAVCILDSSAGVGVFSAPQAVISRERVTVIVNSKYFMVLNIFFLSYSR